MIPYEELVAALARWRAERGLATGLSDYLGEPASAARVAYGYSAPVVVVDHSRDELVELAGDELIDGVLEESRAESYSDADGEMPVEEPAAEALDLDRLDFSEVDDGSEETTPAGASYPDARPSSSNGRRADAPQGKSQRGRNRRRR